MKLDQNFKLSGVAVFLVLVLGGFGCASKTPSESNVGGGGETENVVGVSGQHGAGHHTPTVRDLPTPSKCETNPSLKSNPLCQIVLTGFSGDLTSPNTGKLQGYLKNDYFLDGKLHSTTWYADKNSTQPFSVTSFTYQGDLIGTINSTVDTNRDGNMDQEVNTANDYQNGKLTSTTLSLTALPSNNQLGKNTTLYSFTNIPNPLPPGYPADSSVLEVKFTTEMDYTKNQTVPNAISYEFDFLNSDNLPVETRIVRYETTWDNSTTPWTPKGPMVQKFESVESFQYTDKKLSGSEKNLYDCTKAPSGSCFNSSALDVVTGLQPYGRLDTTFSYPDGRLKHAETVVQGDALSPSGPNAGILNQPDPYKWECDVAYDTSNQKVIAKFPDIFKFIGLSETDKIESFTCDDFGKNLMGGNVTFDEWSYLWQATNQAEPQ